MLKHIGQSVEIVTDPKRWQMQVVLFCRSARLMWHESDWSGGWRTALSEVVLQGKTPTGKRVLGHAGAVRGSEGDADGLGFIGGSAKVR